MLSAVVDVAVKCGSICVDLDRLWMPLLSMRSPRSNGEEVSIG